MSAEPTNGAINEQVAALRRELKLIWNSHEREHTQHEQSHAREHAFSQQAIDTAATLAKENKHDANEWRKTMTDREARFSTTDDVKAIMERLDKIERAGLLAAERETQRISKEADDKREEEKRQAKEKLDQERRQAHSQRMIGLVVGAAATLGSVLINLVIRLSTATP